jgi:beta-lactamase class A
MKYLHHLVCLVALSGVSLPAVAQPGKAPLRELIRRIVDTSQGSVGVGVLGLDINDSLVINDALRFPMQSVYKFPLAMAVLDRVDAGALSVDQKIHIPARDLDKDTWSPLVKEYPGQDITMSLRNLLMYSVSKSDNNACDVLFRLIGGTKAADKFVHDAGIEGMAIAATEAEMKANQDVQYTNFCRPSAMLRLLRLFHGGKLLKSQSNVLLMQQMTQSENSGKRIKGLLPDDIVVAHKTGTGNTHVNGRTSATNDVGIVTLKDGRCYALVIFISDYTGGISRGESLIAAISKTVFDYYTKP